MNPRLQTDCARCCALCCVVPPFDADQGFGFDKPAHRPCRHLAGDDRCHIHGELAARGFPACRAFDCHGAGTWVTQSLFKGACWRSSPAIAQRMFALYPRYRMLHELLWILDVAIGRLPPADAAPLQRRMHAIAALCDGGADIVAGTDVLGVRREVRAELRARFSSRAAAG
ncbi:MAG TPA: hypothetical protein VMF03_07975 [Steroidobacteraceae bacterium]|nr:hypothetical protein [Steroidobacteraceae bacterium]